MNPTTTNSKNVGAACSRRAFCGALLAVPLAPLLPVPASRVVIRIRKVAARIRMTREAVAFHAGRRGGKTTMLLLTATPCIQDQYLSLLQNDQRYC